MRRIVFWTHLTIGLTAGLIVLIMSVTGVLLTYEKQILAWADRPAGIVPPSADAVPLTVESLLARVKAARPESTPATVLVRADPREPAAVSLGRDGNVYVDRYTGLILGEGSPGTRRFFRVVTDWHRWLGRERSEPDLGQGHHRRVQSGVPLPRDFGPISLVAPSVVVASGSRRPVVPARPAGVRRATSTGTM